MSLDYSRISIDQVISGREREELSRYFVRTMGIVPENIDILALLPRLREQAKHIPLFSQAFADNLSQRQLSILLHYFMATFIYDDHWKQVVTILANLGADLNALVEVERLTIVPMTYLACNYGDQLDKIEHLLSLGADVNVIYTGHSPAIDQPCTPLAYALYRRNPELAKLLVRHGAKLEIEMPDGSFKRIEIPQGIDLVCYGLDCLVEEAAQRAGAEFALPFADVAHRPAVTPLFFMTLPTELPHNGRI